MNDISLKNFIEDRLSYELEPYDVYVSDLADDLATDLKSNGYCSEPYFEYAKALMCPINKKGEKYCNCTLCESHSFCELLRKEGYV